MSNPREASDGSPVASSAPKRMNAFTHEQLLEQWDAFIAAHPKEHTLVTTMRAHQPAESEEGANYTCFSVTVVNAVQVEQLNQEKPRILKYLRDALQNDLIDLSFHFDDKVIQPNAWNDRDVLSHLVERHPEIGNLIETLKLSL